MTKKKKGSGFQLGTILALVIMCLFLAISNKNFYSYSNLMSILKQTAFNAFLAVGMLLCLITAGIDLSVGANAVFCACLMGALAKAGMSSGIVLMIIGIVAGGVVGFINGTLLTRLHLPHPFVSTLGMKNVLWGLALLVTGSQMINVFPASVQWLGLTTIGGFPVSFIVVIVLYVVMHIFLSKTALGRSIYCAGGNMEATRLSGINTANVLTFCYTMSGIMAALAGIVSVGRSGICNGANATQPYDTDAIAACIIGGASFTGGKGTMFGTMLGCLIISVLRNGFTLLSIDSAVQNIVLGLVIILAVLMDVIRAQMEAKRRRLAAAK
ncbi:ABC transporter permease [Oscillibacter valericigenes]|uniref:ABC transporter permease n=1 Tax=Oscillibacter valericigenes TaxID=351091 RepID=UPI001F45439D|nr:ABC transporter permease [Oscillibacter valericigenes]MCF2616516.1 ABC transporter permease [Oscillibacter valericigenes]